MHVLDAPVTQQTMLNQSLYYTILCFELNTKIKSKGVVTTPLVADVAKKFGSLKVKITLTIWKYVKASIYTFWSFVLFSAPSLVPGPLILNFATQKCFYSQKLGLLAGRMWGLVHVIFSHLLSAAYNTWSAVPYSHSVNGW